MHALKLLRDCAVSGGLVATPSVLFWITLGLVLHSWPVMLAKTPVTGKKLDYAFNNFYLYFYVMKLVYFSIKFLFWL